MAIKYVYTGKFRAKTLNVERVDLGTTNTYSFVNSFTFNSVVYDPLTDPELALLSDAAYMERLGVFYDWVETQEAGLDVGAISINAAYAPYGVDAVHCSIGTVTGNEVT
jgi:hypothetical protein